MMYPVDDLLLNGRFLTRPMTGVDRVATEMIRALVEVTSGQSDQPVVRTALPRASIDSEQSRPREILDLERIPNPHLSGYMWEQVSLLLTRPNDWLLSLCNLGPVARSKQAVMIHDAQVYSQPHAYSRAFRMFYRTMLPLIARHARILTTVSDFSRRELEAYGVFPRNKAVVIHNGVDHMARIAPDRTVLDRNNLRPGEYFFAIGSLAPHKNIDLILKAARGRRDKDIPLIIAGGANSKVFQNAGLKDEDGVRFIGRVSDAELKALYAEALSLLFPSKTEGFGLPPLEAMYCGCPVIATTGGAVPEVCGNSALYASPESVEEWVAAMDRMRSEPAVRQELVEAGQGHAAGFTWRRAAERLLEAIASSGK